MPTRDRVSRASRDLLHTAWTYRAQKTAAFRENGDAAAMDQTSYEMRPMRRCETSGDTGVLMHKPLGGPGSR